MRLPWMAAAVALTLCVGCERKRIREWRASDHDQPEEPGQVEGAPQAPGGEPAGDVALQAVYRRECAPCHGSDGSGRTPMAAQMPIRDLRASTLSEDEVVHVVTKGRARMPPFGESLDPETIRALAKQVVLLRRAE